MLEDLYFTNLIGGAIAPKVLREPNSTTAGGVYMAKLGDYTFGLDTAAFQQLQRDSAFRWSSIKRIGRSPAQQFTGLDDDTIELSGVIYPHFRGGLQQIGQMRGAAAAGEPLPLIYAFDQVGQYCGLWCIKGVRENRSVFLRDGVSRKIEFTLSLVYYGDDAGGAGAAISLAAAGAEVANTSLAKPPLLGSAGDDLLASAMGLFGLQPIDGDSPAADIRQAAAAVAGIASAAGKVAGTVRALTTGSVGSMAAGAVALLPADARAAINEIVKAAVAVSTAQRDVQASATVFAEDSAGIKRTASGLGTIMSDIQRGAVLHGGIVKSAAASLAAMEQTEGVAAADRITAAAGMRNVAAQADNLAYAASEAAGQAAYIVDLINA